MQNDLQNIADDLEKADHETILEIIREAEKFLDSQLQAGIASDQRAITFSSIIAAVIAILIGGYVTGLAAHPALIKIGFFVLIMIFGLLVSLGLSLWTCRPTTWGYAGNSPRLWVRDIKDGDSLTVSLAGQANQYAISIAANGAILATNAKWMVAALFAAGATLAVSSVVGATLIIRAMSGACC